MKGKNVITINGRLYDAVTGMPVVQQQSQAAPMKPAATPPAQKPHVPQPPKAHRAFTDIMPTKKTVLQTTIKTAQSAPAQQKSTERKTEDAHAMHKKPQKSQTLHRAVVRRPTDPRANQPAKPPQYKSPLISRFGAKSAPTEAESILVTPTQPDAPATVHPAVSKALASINNQQVSTAKQPQQSSKELKEALIKERLAEVDTADQKQKKERRGLFRRQPKLTTILTSSLAILLLGGYLTFINLPNISMRVASTRAGISANFPSYKPDGYSFQGPITYAPGEVSINYKSNTNSASFTLKQQNSNWDSQAVLDNFVNKQTENYLTYQEQGLTIYSFDNKAAWTNGGLLYSIEGNARLSSEQILRLATSM